MPETEAGTGAELAQQPVVLQEAEDGKPMVFGLPPMWTTQDKHFEVYEPQPRRLRGTIIVSDAASFRQAVNDRTAQELNPPTIYADDQAHKLTAVLNDDRADGPGWRDYRVESQLLHTPEWLHWRSKDGQLMSQEAFAEHIEDGIPELVTPPAGEVLDLAQTFHATTAARFKSGRRLASGETQFMYEEQMEAKAGTAGTIEIPSELVLSVAPFKGGDPLSMTALFRFRVNREAGLLLGYKLQRPYEVEDDAFERVVQRVTSDLSDLHVITGPAPTPR